MPRDINPFAPVLSPELLAKATGAGRKLPPGVTGSPPLPADQPIVADHLTMQERQALDAVGFEVKHTATASVPQQMTAGIPDHPAASPTHPVVPETVPGLNAAIALAGQAIAAQAASQDASAGPTDTGVVQGPAACPHCGWDMHVADVPEPPHSEKMAFLHTFLGGVPYVKEVKLFDGTVELTFRTLTVRELELVYRQAFRDKENGKFQGSELDYWTQLNRYRLVLQLQRYRHNAPGGFDHDLADGYSLEANPAAVGVWVTPETEAGIKAGDTGLPAIDEYVTEKVLKTEAVFAVVNKACADFNRLAAKMEAMADNSDFWKPTAQPS